MAPALCGWRAPPAAAAARPRPISSRTAARQRPVSKAAAASATTQQQAVHPTQRHRALKDPAKICGSSRHAVPVPDRGGQLSLDAYMRLPTEQYDELDPSMILPLGNSAFLLKVPRVQLFDMWLEPEVTVHVRQQEGPVGLVFESGECRLRGSEMLQRLGLDKRFVLYFRTAVSWQPGPGSPGSISSISSGSGSSNGGRGNGVPAASAPGPEAALPPIPGGGGASGHGQISAEAEVSVWSEVVGPFQAIPRPMLQATGNAVLGAIMSALLPVFMRKLADDYQRWASSPQYRARRATAAAGAAVQAPGAQAQQP